MDNLRWIRFAVVIIALAIVILILHELKSVFIPLTFALFLSFLFAPLNRFLMSHGVPKAMCITLMVIIIFITFTLAGTLVYAGISNFIDEMPVFMANMASLVEQMAVQLELPIKNVHSTIHNIDWFDMLDRFQLQDRLQQTLGNFADFIFKLVLTIFFMIFIVMGRERFVVRLSNAMPSSGKQHTANIYLQVETQIIRYLVVKTLISLATALVGMFFVWLFGVEFIIVSGLLLFFLNFIPNIGSIIASLFPIIVCFFQYGFGWRLVGIAAALTVIQMTFGNFLEPKIMGTRLNLSPVIILISLIFWAWVWGPMGMVLAVPFTSALQIIAREFDSLKILSAILSDD